MQKQTFFDAETTRLTVAEVVSGDLQDGFAQLNGVLRLSHRLFLRVQVVDVEARAIHYGEPFRESMHGKGMRVVGAEDIATESEVIVLQAQLTE